MRCEGEAFGKCSIRVKPSDDLTYRVFPSVSEYVTDDWFVELAGLEPGVAGVLELELDDCNEPRLDIEV